MSDYEYYRSRAADALSSVVLLAVVIALYALLGFWSAVAFACGVLITGAYYTIRAAAA